MIRLGMLEADLKDECWFLPYCSRCAERVLGFAPNWFAVASELRTMVPASQSVVQPLSERARSKERAIDAGQRDWSFDDSGVEDDVAVQDPPSFRCCPMRMASPRWSGSVRNVRSRSPLVGGSVDHRRRSRGGG
jgi:hypothetical protein